MFAIGFLAAVAGVRAALATDGEEFFYFGGTINNKYRIFMSFEYVGGSVRGEYFYESSGSYIRLSGYREGPQIDLVETADGKETGRFSGMFERGVYRGTWTNADGSRSFPFEVGETRAPTFSWEFSGSASKDDGKYSCSVTLGITNGDISNLVVEVSASYGYAPHACYLGFDGMQQSVGSTYLELYHPEDPDCRLHITDAGNCLVLRFRGSCRAGCGQNAWFEDVVIYKYELTMKVLGIPNQG
jgi:hypothetical protein